MSANTRFSSSTDGPPLTVDTSDGIGTLNPLDIQKIAIRPLTRYCGAPAILRHAVRAHHAGVDRECRLSGVSLAAGFDHQGLKLAQGRLSSAMQQFGQLSRGKT